MLWMLGFLAFPVAGGIIIVAAYGGVSLILHFSQIARFNRWLRDGVDVMKSNTRTGMWGQNPDYPTGVVRGANSLRRTNTKTNSTGSASRTGTQRTRWEDAADRDLCQKIRKALVTTALSQPIPTCQLFPMVAKSL